VVTEPTLVGAGVVVQELILFGPITVQTAVPVGAIAPAPVTVAVKVKVEPSPPPPLAAPTRIIFPVGEDLPTLIVTELEIGSAE
jgi:hypothetical protein